MNKKKWIKRLLITLAVLLCGFAIFEIIVHVLMDSEMSSRDDWNIQLGERMYTSEERGVSLYSAPWNWYSNRGTPPSTRRWPS